MLLAQKVYPLQGDLHRTRRRSNREVQGQIHALIGINELADLGPVNVLQLVDVVLQILPH